MEGYSILITGAIVLVSLSLLCSATTQAIQYFSYPKLGLYQRRFRRWLGDAAWESVIRHPLVTSLTAKGRFRSSLPPLSPSIFVTALLDAFSGPIPAGSEKLKRIRQVLEEKPSAPIKIVIGALMSDDYERLEANLKAWYADALNVLDAEYQNSTRLLMLFVAFFLVLVLHFNLLTVLETYSDYSAQLNTLHAAEAISGMRQALPNPSSTQEAVTAIVYPPRFPLGWYRPDSPKTHPDMGLSGLILIEVFGLILTTVAVALGSPFWLSILQTFVKGA
jgi:hypothetical protein